MTSASTLEVKCQRCDHLLSEHQDFHTKSSPTEILASAGNPDHIQEHFRKPPNNPTRCLRKDTVSKLAAAVDSQNVIHIRGTPASGKTVLSELLRDYYVENNRKVFLLETWEPLESFHGKDPWTRFALLLQQRYPEYSHTEFFASKTVIVVDEAQASYKDSYFWNTIVKERRSGEGEDINICLFCSYGSPLTGLEVDHLWFSPATFGPAQRITLTPQPGKDSPKLGLFFTPDEFDEAVSLLTTNKYEEKFTIDKEAMSYLYELTNGHPGGVTSLVNFVHSAHRHDLKHRCISTITKDHLLDNLKDDTQVFQYLTNQAVFRSFPTGGHLTPEAGGTLCKTLEEGNMRFNSDDVGMQQCYERGWVHRISVGEINTYDVVVLPSRLHEKWLEFIIGQDTRPLPARFNQLDTLCLEVLSKFSTINLRHAVQGKKMSTAAKCRPMEAQYQDEFYRSFNLLAGRGVPICSEWSRTSDGRVGFYIPEKKWAIELLRDHDRVNEHISRFKEGGRYFSWLKENMVEDWIIINCASSPPIRGYSEPRLWTAVFANNYSELKVYDYQERPLIDIRLQN
ncbi:uncharacterized protein BDW43DRAFT_314033 [Aspergillus alliaceus]|uniref:uncharacterized protein n=1 Tax=Petromyces alliaceus TaxID=209559 RepID=UPI0012A74E67|nr:uncharacterized protein BDW43DRAFT_314033 [Aspergillus alliaceus]KAB8230344.1 hypothetical protein BDW43DRAFT_314033 [Aspergillus alliaceus]